LIWEFQIMQLATPEPTPFVAYDVFVSYAHEDDHDGWVAALVKAIKAEHAMFTPTPLNVFFDREEIRTMHDWEHRILSGLRHSKVMLAVLSPKYFGSVYCRKEWEIHCDHELDRCMPGEGIAPIYAVTIPAFEETTAATVDGWVANLRRRQYMDLRMWRTVGTEAMNREDIRSRIQRLDQDLARTIAKAERIAASPTTIPPHNPHFVGRVDEMERLRRTLALGRVGAIAAVHGLGGMGKSALAFEYAHAHADDYPGGRYLVSCSGVTDLRFPIINLCERKGITLTEDEKKDASVAFARVRTAFERGPRSLLLLDNIDDAALLAPHRLSLHLPSADSVHSLVTTRLEPERLIGLECLSLDTLPELDALRLLETYRGLTDDEERKSAQQIVRRLGGYPLAIEMVGVFLWQTAEVTYRGYAKRLEDEGLEALLGIAGEDRVELSRHPVKLLTVLLEPTLARLTPPEWLALQYAALLPQGQIAMSWVRVLVSQAYPEVGTMPDPGHPDPWERLLRRLYGLRLLLPGDSDKVARMHRLVQDVVAARLEPVAVNERWVALIAHVFSRALFLWDGWVDRASRWEIEPVRDFAMRLLDTHALEIGVVLAIRVERPLDRLGRFNESRALLKRAAMNFEDGHVPLLPILATCYSNLAAVEMNLGNLPEAKRLSLQAIAIDRHYKNTDQPVHASRLSNLGVIEQKLGNPRKARRRLARAIAILKKLDNPDLSTLATCYSNLATVEGDLGNPDQARRLLRQAIEIWEDGTAPDHHKLASLYSNLATIELDLQNFDESKQLLLHAIEIANEVHDPDHPSFITLYSNLAMAEHKLGNLPAAKQLLMRAIAIEEQTYGVDHPDLAIRLSNLATVEQAMGNVEGIRQLMQRTYSIRLARLGPMHPETRSSAAWLSRDDQNRCRTTPGV
jgi:tetratricopeptide (TPR) repeat protein